MDARLPLVLNVEDEAWQRYATSRVLRQAGFRVEEADSGGEALRLVALRPDAIVLDVNLPDMNGLEVVRRLKADPQTASIPILHLTATHRSPESWANALEGGADGFLVAPVEPPVLVATLRALLRARRAENALREQWEVLDTVTRVGQMVAAELDPRRVVQAVSDAVRDLTHARYAAVLGGGARTGPLALLASAGLTPEAAAALREELADGPVAVMVMTPDRLIVPVISRAGHVSGLMVAGDPQPGGFGARDELILRGLASQTAVALDNARLFDETQHLYREAVEANRLKDEFLATLSHELRTPLNAIVGWAHLLRAGRLDPATTTKAIDTITRNAEAQNQLISDILDVSRIVAGKLRLEIAAVDLSAVIDAALDTVRPGADAKGIRLEKIVDPAAGPITGDAHRLQQVVWNLLSNAIKFTPKKGRIQVRLEATASQVRLTIADTGPGIAPEFLPHVFERFRQADASTTRRHTGLGLGLAIVRHLVELHGGTVRASNREEGTGAVMTVQVPLRAVGDAPAGGAVVAGGPLDQSASSLA
ncbi:MAG TPA: ATP-binding protein, partial [Vicinamibacteria bacterium]|nr:ATP-binding protein [Vicinamibacteria bacterium]